MYNKQRINSSSQSLGNKICGEIKDERAGNASKGQSGFLLRAKRKVHSFPSVLIYPSTPVTLFADAQEMSASAREVVIIGPEQPLAYP